MQSANTGTQYVLRSVQGVGCWKLCIWRLAKVPKAAPKVFLQVSSLEKTPVHLLPGKERTACGSAMAAADFGRNFEGKERPIGKGRVVNKEAGAAS